MVKITPKFLNTPKTYEGFQRLEEQDVENKSIPKQSSLKRSTSKNNATVPYFDCSYFIRENQGKKHADVSFYTGAVNNDLSVEVLPTNMRTKLYHQSGSAIMIPAVHDSIYITKKSLIDLFNNQAVQKLMVETDLDGQVPLAELFQLFLARRLQANKFAKDFRKISPLFSNRRLR